MAETTLSHQPIVLYRTVVEAYPVPEVCRTEAVACAWIAVVSMAENSSCPSLRCLEVVNHLLALVFE
jgi:hypothetical protein